MPDTAAPVELSTKTIAQLISTDMREDLLAILREIFERNTLAERLAYSPDEAAELLGISRELVHDLLRTGQLGSVRAGRRRLIAKHHLEAFLADEDLGKNLYAFPATTRPCPCEDVPRLDITWLNAPKVPPHAVDAALRAYRPGLTKK